VTAQLNGIKSRLAKIQAGIPATTTCQWTFGQSPCMYDKEATKLVGEVLAVGTPERVSISFDVGSGVTPNSLFKRGIIKVAGMAFTIRQSRNNGTFDCMRVPPPSLVGRTAHIYEGCDKQRSTCISRGQESQFMALGIRIPARQPLFERE